MKSLLLSIRVFMLLEAFISCEGLGNDIWGQNWKLLFLNILQYSLSMFIKWAVALLLLPQICLTRQPSCAVATVMMFASPHGLSCASGTNIKHFLKFTGILQWSYSETFGKKWTKDIKSDVDFNVRKNSGITRLSETECTQKCVLIECVRSDRTTSSVYSKSAQLTEEA